MEAVLTCSTVARSLLSLLRAAAPVCLPEPSLVTDTLLDDCVLRFSSLCSGVTSILPSRRCKHVKRPQSAACSPARNHGAAHVGSNINEAISRMEAAQADTVLMVTTVPERCVPEAAEPCHVRQQSLGSLGETDAHRGLMLMLCKPRARPHLR